MNIVLAAIAVTTLCISGVAQAQTGQIAGLEQAFETSPGALGASTSPPGWRAFQRRMAAMPDTDPMPIASGHGAVPVDGPAQNRRKTCGRHKAKARRARQPTPAICTAAVAKRLSNAPAGSFSWRPEEQLVRLRAVDRRVNALPYVSDARNWGVADYWETPAEMFARGGDCEGFALTKLHLLRQLGMAEADLRVAVVWDRRDREEHAVLLARVDGRIWILDNKTPAPSPLDQTSGRYRLIYSVTDAGLRMATRPASREVMPMRLADGGRTLVLAIAPRRPGGIDTVYPAGR